MRNLGGDIRWDLRCGLEGLAKDTGEKLIWVSLGEPVWWHVIWLVVTRYYLHTREGGESSTGVERLD